MCRFPFCVCIKHWFSLQPLLPCNTAERCTSLYFHPWCCGRSASHTSCNYIIHVLCNVCISGGFCIHMLTHGHMQVHAFTPRSRQVSHRPPWPLEASMLGVLPLFFWVTDPTHTHILFKFKEQNNRERLKRLGWVSTHRKQSPRPRTPTHIKHLVMESLIRKRQTMIFHTVAFRTKVSGTNPAAAETAVAALVNTQSYLPQRCQWLNFLHVLCNHGNQRKHMADKGPEANFTAVNTELYRRKKMQGCAGVTSLLTLNHALYHQLWTNIHFTSASKREIFSGPINNSKHVILMPD